MADEAAAQAQPTATTTSKAAQRMTKLKTDMEQLAADSKTEVLAISDGDAGEVAPRDLMNPINTELMPTGDFTIDTLWDGTTANFISYSRALKTAISAGRLGYYSDYTCELLGLHLYMAVGVPVTTHAGYKALVRARCAQLNRFRDSAIDQGKRSLFAAILRSLDTTTRDQICADGIDDEIDSCPDALWTAIRKHAQGPFAKTTGAALMTAFFSMTWDSTADTIVAQVDFNFRALNELLHTSEALGELGYSISVPTALVKAIAIMPDGLRVHERTYNAYTTLTKLRDEMRCDAARLDASAAQGLKSFAVRDSEITEMKAEMAQLRRSLQQRQQQQPRSTTKPTRGNGLGKNGRHQFTDDEMMDKDFKPPAGVPWRFTKFCSVHGHSTTHGDEGCYVLHPELKPSDHQ